jgi:hypothetical protein
MFHQVVQLRHEKKKKKSQQQKNLKLNKPQELLIQI